MINWLSSAIFIGSTFAKPLNKEAADMFPVSFVKKL